MMDTNGDGDLEKSEAVAFWGKNFAKVNAGAMFNEVDTDNSELITFDEWMDFWNNVLATGTYSEEDILEELTSMMEGGSWVDWNDGRSTGS